MLTSHRIHLFIIIIHKITISPHNSITHCFVCVIAIVCVMWWTDVDCKLYRFVIVVDDAMH